MKKIFFVTLFFVAAIFSFSQAQQIANVTSLETYINDKFNDTFTFELSEKMTIEEIREQSSYYTKYFTTTFDEKENSITMKMTNQDWSNRQIMRRLFAGLQIENVILEGKEIRTDEFFKEYVLTTDPLKEK